ncbi:hypothetical protein F511_32459 [Dorcoceras hygrometricum]|uniref:Uncharacterized protein n=1 Tax=Dorcoceras hygrometricum TaxID=472368 RepID=A0A2Z7CG38_9LAMI|nr:hypothetical protein F511_32459 [Dorcoceras hygrometricum]
MLYSKLKSRNDTVPTKRRRSVLPAGNNISCKEPDAGCCIPFKIHQQLPSQRFETSSCTYPNDVAAHITISRYNKPSTDFRSLDWSLIHAKRYRIEVPVHKSKRCRIALSAVTKFHILASTDLRLLPKRRRRTYVFKTSQHINKPADTPRTLAAGYYLLILFLIISGITFLPL